MNPAPEKEVAAVLLLIGLASFGVLVWLSRKLMSLDRALDIGDAMVLGVFALFAAFCFGIAGYLFRVRSFAAGPSEQQAAPASPPKRVTISNGCATVGVFLLILSVLVPAGGYPVILLFVGLALLAVSHALTPCIERLEQLRKARDSVRQL